MSGHVGLACLCLLALSVSSSRQQEATELPSGKNVTAEQAQTISELTQRNSELQARLLLLQARLDARKEGEDLTCRVVVEQLTGCNAGFDAAQINLFNKSDEILEEINNIKTKVEEGFATMMNERDSKYTALQSKHEETLKVTNSTKKLASIPALDMVLLGDHYYFFNKETKLSWHAARDICVSKGLTLASIESAEENLLLLDQWKKLGMAVPWIGGNDEAEEGTWRWTGTGATLTYTNWGEGEPNGDDEQVQNCMEMRGDGRWYDYVCKRTQPFICELQNE